MLRSYVIVFFIICCCFSLLIGQEETAKKTKTVQAIDIYGLKTFKKEDILQLLQTKVGGEFDKLIWAEDKVKLEKTLYFKDVKMEAKEREKYFRLVVTVEEAEFIRTVKSIEIIGLKNIPQAQIIANMKTQIGKDFNPFVFDRDIIKLHGMSFSKDIKASHERLTDGYAIKIHMSEDVDWYDDYEVIMKKGLKGGVKENMEEQILLSKEGDFLDETHIEMVKRRVAEYFKTKGYFFVEIRTSVRLEKDKKVLLFNINRGPKLRIKEFVYKGNKRYSDKYINENARVGSWANRGYNNGRHTFNEVEFEEDKVRITQFYNLNGFINAKIEVTPFQYNASKDRVYISFNINEGPRYFIGDIKFTGNTLFAQEDLLAVLKLLPGSPFNSRIIYEDAKNIEGLYGDEGRLFTIAEPKFVFDTDRHIVNVVYSIKERGIVKIGKVYVNGNNVTKESVFLKELEIFPGDIYDRYKFDRSKFNIKQRLPFIDSQAFKMEVVPSGEDTGDIIIDITEKQSGSLSFNVSLTDFESLTAGVKVTESNFNWQSLFGLGSIKGGGQSISAQADAGLKTQRYVVKFSNPMIFDLPIKFEMSSYWKELETREFDRTQIGGYSSVGKKLIGDLWGSIGYRIERAKIDDLDENVAQIILDEEKDYTISALVLNLIYDRRNNFMMPFSGYRIQLGETIAEGKILGDRTFTSSSFELSGYLHLLDKIDNLNQKKYPYFFAMHFLGEANFSYDGDSVPLTERYTTGGNSTVRGFKAGRLAPRDEDGRLFPGNFQLIGNFEFNIPLYNDIIYLAPFVDAGYVWADIKDYDFDDFRVSTGVTVKFRIPALQNQPIMLSYSHSLRDKSGDELEEFSISFVTAF